MPPASLEPELTMHLLFVTSRLPYPPNRGDRLRVFNFIRELSREHRITLLTFLASQEETANLAGLRPYCADIHPIFLPRAQSMLRAATRAWRAEPLQAHYYYSPTMQQAVDELVQTGGFDLLYAHLFRMAPYARFQRGIYRVLDMTDVISAEIARAMPYHDWRWRAIYRNELPRIRRYEQELVEHFDETWVISETERTTLAATGAQGRVEVVPNGVDSERFRPTGRRRDRATVLFVGHMGVPHNEDAAEYLAREILPRIRAGVPDARLDLVGAEPSARVKRLAKLEGVSVLGHVPDLNAVLARATVFVAPLRFAAGVQNKVLEAMAAGTPVVTTGIVSEGLGTSAGRHLIVADLPEDIAAETVRLIKNRQLGDELARAARGFVESHYRWSAVSDRVAEIARTAPN